MRHEEIKAAERTLRHYDKALRLRRSVERPVILIERKTRRGRIGAVLRDGLEYTPDAGIRAELGHVAVGSVPDAGFNLRRVLDSLKQSDSWRFDRPSWYWMEERDARRDALQRERRQQGIRYKTEDFWNRYCWATGARVTVGAQLQ